MGLPMALNTAMHDMMCGACISLNLCPLLSQGQIEALEHHANAAIDGTFPHPLSSSHPSEQQANRAYATAWIERLRVARIDCLPDRLAAGA